MIVKRVKQWLQGDAPEQAAAEDPRAVRVLMVCMGNICRSPTAEGVLRAKLRLAELQGRVVVDSAGTHGYHTGEAPDPRAIRHAAQRGYDISRLQARPVVPADFQRFHWLLAMDEANLAWLNKRVPEGAAARIELLMPHASQHRGQQEVPDPYYGGPAGFDRVLDLVEDACDGFVLRLQSELGKA
jgi:protein-tyrosine phosphatase